MDGRLGMAAVHSPDCNCKQRWRDSNLPVFSDGISWRVSPSVIITTIYCVPWVFFSLKNNNNNNKKQPQTYYISMNFNLRDGLCALQGEIM